MGNKKSKSKVQLSLRVLILGIGASGKSTFSKQMKLVHSGGFSSTELQNFKSIVHTNILIGMKDLCLLTIDTLKLELESANRKKGRFFANLGNQVYDLKLDNDLCARVMACWNDTTIQKVFKQYGCPSIPAIEYLMKNIKTISAPSYVPTEDDIVRVRQRSSGVSVTSFVIDGREWSLVDVGGQKPERQRWSQVMNDGCNAIIFFVALDEYDVPSFEDDVGTKMDEALGVWKEVVRSAEAKRSGILLMLNKIDLFTQKFQKDPAAFAKVFPTYKGKDVDKAVEQISKKFLDQAPSEIEDNINTHITCALDKDMMSKVFDVVVEHILMTRMQM
eukprot:TRINITY_DN10367_c0_g1_i1.p1 TRINITY_DN10367_c0_g1~~TRINITY_DN10367_c0_g1_i1.p1  ORF type:complete len:332 (-),score=55.66 TRINITY_DN10367_c0_g1_i1:113-1108(-)